MNIDNKTRASHGYLKLRHDDLVFEVNREHPNIDGLFCTNTGLITVLKRYYDNKNSSMKTMYVPLKVYHYRNKPAIVFYKKQPFRVADIINKTWHSSHH